MVSCSINIISLVRSRICGGLAAAAADCSVMSCCCRCMSCTHHSLSSPSWHHLSSLLHSIYSRSSAVSQSHLLYMYSSVISLSRLSHSNTISHSRHSRCSVKAAWTISVRRVSVLPDLWLGPLSVSVLLLHY